MDLLRKPFSCEMRFSVAQREFTALFTKYSSDNLLLEMQTPESVEGLGFGYTPEEVSVSLKGVKLSLALDQFPMSSVGNILFSLYNESGGEDLQVTRQGDELLLTQPVFSDTAVIVFDAQTLVPKRMYTEKSGLSIDYSNYVLLDA